MAGIGEGLGGVFPEDHADSPDSEFARIKVPMSPEKPTTSLRCWDCGAENDPGASECWLCQRPDWHGPRRFPMPLKPGPSPASGRATAPVNDAFLELVVRAKPLPTSGFVTALIGLALGLVALGSFTIGPGFVFGLVILSVGVVGPPWLAGAVTKQRASRPGKPLSALGKVVWVLGLSIVFYHLLGLLVAVALLIALWVTCWATDPRFLR